MDQKQSEVRERIIQASIVCIEREGLHNLTVRSVAREAGVNSAAINYYFGSKDRLIEEVLSATSRTGIEENISDFLSGTGDPLEAVRSMLDHMLEGTINYPNLIKAHISDMFLKNEYKPEQSRQFGLLFSHIEKKLLEAFPGKDKADVRLRVIGIWSAIMLPGILPGLFDPWSGIDLKDPEKRRRYVENVTEF